MQHAGLSCPTVSVALVLNGKLGSGSSLGQLFEANPGSEAAMAVFDPQSCGSPAPALIKGPQDQICCGVKSLTSTGATAFSSCTERRAPSIRDSMTSSCSMESQPS